MRGHAKKGIELVTSCSKLTSMTLVFLPSQPVNVMLNSTGLQTYISASHSQPWVLPTAKWNFWLEVSRQKNYVDTDERMRQRTVMGYVVNNKKLHTHNDFPRPTLQEYIISRTKSSLASAGPVLWILPWVVGKVGAQALITLVHQSSHSMLWLPRILEIKN